jgi:hypothetical protein
VIEPGGIQSEWSQIATNEAQRYSAAGAYAGLVAKFSAMQSRQRKLPGPGTISDLVVKALKSRHPKPRYHAGFLAGPMLFLRHHLSDRLFDRLISLAMR